MFRKNKNKLNIYDESDKIKSSTKEEVEDYNKSLQNKNNGFVSWIKNVFPIKEKTEQFTEKGYDEVLDEYKRQIAEDKQKHALKAIEKRIKKAEKKHNNEQYIKSLEKKEQELVKKLPNDLAGRIKENAIKIWNYIKDPKADLPLKIACVGAVIYLVSPLDAVPDIIPVVGFLDDIAVMSFTVGMVAKNIQGATESAKQSLTNITKGIADGLTETLDEKVELQTKARIRQQLIVTAISLGGAVLIGLIALLISHFG